MLSILAKGITGAIVGYITNDIAIQMLFRKRFGMGGIFLKTRDEFIQNISVVVERDIINHHTLEDELNTESFESTLIAGVEDYFQNHLVETFTRELLVGDIPGLDTSFQNLKSDFRKTLPSALYPILNRQISQIQISEAASEAQLHHISELITGTFAENTEGFGFMSGFINQFYEESSRESLKDFFSPVLIDKFSGNLIRQTEDLHTLLSERFSDRTDTLLRAVPEALDLEELIENLAEGLSEKRIYDLLGKENSRKVAEQIIIELQKILENEEGEKIIKAFADFLIRTLEQEEKTIFELFNEDIGERITHFFEKNFPPILIKVISWLYSKQEDLERLIDRTFTENVDSKFKSWLVSTFLGSISRNAGVIEKLADMLDEYRKNPEAPAQELSRSVTTYLQKQSIGDIVADLKDNNTVVSLTSLLLENVKRALDSLDAKQLDYIFEKKLSNFVSPKEMKTFLRSNVERMIFIELKEKYLFSPRLTKTISDEAGPFLDRFINRRVSELLSPERINKLALEAEGYVLPFILDNQNRINSFLFRTLDDKLSKKTLSSLLSADQVNKMVGFIGNSTEVFLEKEYAEARDKELYHYLMRLNRVPGLHRDLGVSLKKVLMNNLPRIMEGRIEEIVRNNLRHQPASQIRDMVEKFMGKELKPITRLGAMWGGVAGLALSGMPSGGSLWAGLLLPAAAYGFTGLGTNWLALKMIFRPYRQKKLLGMNVPFTPGVSIKNQPRFAKSMSKFVGQKLMNKDGLSRSIEQHKSVLQDELLGRLAKDNYAPLEDFLNEHRGEIAEKVTKKGLEYLKAYLPDALGALEKLLEEYQSHKFEGLDTDTPEYKLSNYLREKETADTISEEIISIAERFLKKDNVLSETLPSSALKAIVESLRSSLSDNVDDFFERIDREEFVKKLIARLNEQFQKSISKSLSQYMNDEQEAELIGKFSDFLYKQVVSERTREGILKFMDKRISDEIAPDKSISELFGGKLIEIVNENLEFILTKVMDQAGEWVHKNRHKIADLVYEKAFEENKMSALYKKAIRSTALDLAENGIPSFLEREKQSLSALVSSEVDRLGQVTLDTFGISLDRNFLNERVIELIQSPRTQQSVKDLASTLLDSLFDIPIQTFLRLGDIRALEDLQRILYDEIRQAGKHLKEHYRENKDSVFGEAESFMRDILSSILDNTRFSDLLHEITDEELRDFIRKTVGLVFESDTFELQVRRLISKFFAALKEKPLSELLDKDTLQKDLRELAARLINNPESLKQISDALTGLIRKSIRTLNANVETDTKDFLGEKLSASVISSLEEKLPEFLEALDIQKIVVSEIEKMPPENIEALFKSFAKKYFDRLVQYGFGFGTAFGLVIDLALVFLLKQFGLV